MNEPIEEAYFNWLCAKVLTVTVPIYWGLMRILHQKEFSWIVTGDKNRAADGVELRDDFFRETHLPMDESWYAQPCSIFEALLAFANRASFQMDEPARDWFWKFMTNLDLDEYRQVYEEDVPIIEDILDTFVWRTYEPSGHGGMFPMRWPQHDQREVEIWYQFCQYVDDQGLL